MEEEGKNTSEAWGLPISNVDTFSNLTDSQFLVRVLGPKHMGYEVIWAKYSMASELQKVPHRTKQGAGTKAHGIYRVIYIACWPQSFRHGRRQNFHQTMPGI